MNQKAKMIVNDLINEGLISSEVDLTGNDKTNILFNYMIKKYSYLLDNSVDNSEQLKNRELFHKVLTTFGKYFLKNKQVFVNNQNRIKNSNEPIIYLSNHRFKDDVLASLLSIDERAFVFFGSVPLFYGTTDGFLLSQNGVILVNRKEKESKKSSVEKAKNILKNNKSLLLFPEGVWNKSPNKLLLDFYTGFYRIAQKDNGDFYKVVPIVHYISNTNSKDKNNKIYTSIGNPIDLSSMSKEEAVIKVRDIMATMYYDLMDKYGHVTREELLDGYKDSVDAWENELISRVSTATKYDVEIETTAEKKDNNNALDVWTPVANLKYNNNNIEYVVSAKKLVRTLKRNDFQHKF